MFTIEMQVNGLNRILIVLTLLASGRAMTLAFLHRVGDGGPGDPPDAWLMPLVGDAIVGVSALVVAWLLWRWPSPATWLVAVVWTVVAAFDAFAAWLVEISVPWADFFMLELLGRVMFPAAIALHIVILVLLLQPQIRARYGLAAQAVDTA